MGLVTSRSTRVTLIVSKWILGVLPFVILSCRVSVHIRFSVFQVTYLCTNIVRLVDKFNLVKNLIGVAMELDFDLLMSMVAEVL